MSIITTIRHPIYRQVPALIGIAATAWLAAATFWAVHAAWVPVA